MNQNQGNNLNEDVLQHSGGVRNQPGGSTQGGIGPYQRTPANYAGGPGSNANAQITLYAQNGQTKQTTTDANGAISDADRQWLANNGGALPISEVPAHDKAIVGTGTGAAAHMAGDTHQIGTKPLDNRAPGSYNQNSGSPSGNNNQDLLQHSSGVRNQPGGSAQGGIGPYQRTPANYAGGPGPNANAQITLYAQNGQTKQTTTDANGAISDADRQWLANNGGALPISEVPAQDKAIVGTGTGAAAHMAGDTHQIGTKPLDNRAPGSYNQNYGSVSDQ
jgi:hypothetical protein